MKNQTGKFAKISLIILLGMFVTYLHGTSAFAVDFITKKEFEAQKSPYQDYPLKILFKKLAESDASEKKMIRNTIILKQVFDRNMQEKIKAGLISYQETFGTISNISNDNLKLWLPKTDSSISFYLGIDHIPLVNDHNYEILESNINKYAAVIYSLDNRVYQIKISFLPTAPDDLYMQRENNKNIVGWKRPTTAREPVGYKLFINEELFGQVKETHVKVPRTNGQVDEYYVKAVYKHGDSLIESDASDIQTDAITAKEVQQEILAGETYDRIVASLNHFEKVYSTQIASLKRSGNKSIRGLLSLPAKNRAEVIFLLELDRLKNENEGDEDLVKEGLEILYESVDNGEGPWAVTPASKRRKIKRHIEKYVE